MGAGETGFACSRLSGEDQMFMGFEPGSLREREDLPTVEPPCCGEVDVLDTGVGEAQFGGYQPIGQTLVGTNGDLPVSFCI